MGWAMQSEMQLLDRSNNPYGLITDRGWMYAYAPYMNDEFLINRFTFNATPTDDYIWFRSPNAVRISAGDYDDLDLMTSTELRLDVELIPKHRIRIWGYNEHNPVLSRSFMNIGYQYQLSEKLAFGFRHTLGSKEVDLDVSAYAQLGNEQTGLIKAEATAVDYLNNVVEGNVSSGFYYSDSIRRYIQQPFMFQVAAVSPSDRAYRAEMFLAYHTKAIAEIRSLNIPAQKYGYNHSGWFAGGLLEYKTQYATLGSLFKYLYSFSQRDSISSTSFNPKYTTEQTEMHKGFYILASASQLNWETWLWMIDYTDLQDGSSFVNLSIIDRKYLHKEKRLVFHNRLWVRPDYRGWMIGLEHLMDLRNKKVDVPSRAEGEAIPVAFDPIGFAYPSAYHNNNNRLIGIIGYQFHPRALVQAGYGYDLDKDFHRKVNGEFYDNAFLKLEFRW